MIFLYVREIVIALSLIDKRAPKKREREKRAPGGSTNGLEICRVYKIKLR
jgi:hypothetical protein